MVAAIWLFQKCGRVEFGIKEEKKNLFVLWVDEVLINFDYLFAILHYKQLT